MLFFQELRSVIPSYQKGEPMWSELRMFGVGWWLCNITMLRRCIEKLAKAAFTANKNPLDAAIFYLAMKKKAVVWGLFRYVLNPRVCIHCAIASRYYIISLLYILIIRYSHYHIMNFDTTIYCLFKHLSISQPLLSSLDIWILSSL